MVGVCGCPATRRELDAFRSPSRPSRAGGTGGVANHFRPPLADCNGLPVSAMNTLVDMERVRRELVLESCRQYFAQRPSTRFMPGETYIAVTGKDLDAEDLVHLVDDSPDLWPTSGRDASELQPRLP